MFSRLLPLLLTVPPLLVAASPPLRLHHRTFHPSLPDTPYSELAILHLSGSGPAAETRLVPSQTYAENLREYFSAVEGLTDALYQVALERPGDVDQTQWATSSVLAVSPSFSIRLPTACPRHLVTDYGALGAPPVSPPSAAHPCPVRPSLRSAIQLHSNL